MRTWLGCAATGWALVGPAALAERAVPARPVADAVVPAEGDVGPSAIAPALAPAEIAGAADLVGLAGESAWVIDAELVGSSLVAPEGLRVLVTEYRFRVLEWVRGGGDAPAVTVREIGGLEGHGGGMVSHDSHHLEVGGRYLLFGRHGADELLVPFRAVLQVLDDGDVVATPGGGVYFERADGGLEIRPVEGVRSALYLPDAGHGAHAPGHAGCPTHASEPIPPQEPMRGEEDQAPVKVETVLELLRPADAGDVVRLGPTPAGLDAFDVERWNYCGWIDRSNNYFALMPDDDHWSWFLSSMGELNYLVEDNPSGPDWLVGYFLSGGNPIRDRAPVAGNGDNNTAVPSSATLTAGGYPTWAAMNNANGVCFTWFSGDGCTRIVETDVFVNPSIGADEPQFRKTMTHELGHALALGHEDRTVALMVSGTWRIPPNYSSNYYSRMDDCVGVRAMLNGSNGIVPNTWVIEDWADAATWSQTHPNWGTSADVQPHVTQLSTYNATQGETIQIEKMHVENRGTLPISDLDLKIYFSTNTIISASDHLVWSGGWSTFGAENAWWNGTLNITIPMSVPPGTYYIGWQLTTPTSEPVSTANNTAIMVRDFFGSYAPRQITVAPAPPPNDRCIDASPVSIGTYVGTTIGADSDGTGTCGASGSSPDVWYRYTAACDGTVEITTCGSDFDTVLSAWTGCRGIEMICNDDALSGACSGTPQSRIVMDVQQGVSYRIRVSGFSGASGDFQLNIAACVPSTCEGDVNGDGATNTFDFGDLADHFGAGPGATREMGDLNGDGWVNTFDFGILADDFGCVPN
jgi:hypothetical protein